MASELSVRESLELRRRAAIGRGIPVGDASVTESEAYQQAKEKIVQSVAQSAAIAVQNAVEMVRNVSTVEVVAIGVATAKWIETPENVAYAAVIEASMATIQQAGDAMLKIGEDAAQVLEQFK